MDKEILKNGLKEWGYDLSPLEEERFFKYSKILLEWNEKMNLTALKEPKDISIKHFLDSVSLIFKKELSKNAKIIDVGTGAGFPGIPLKIMREDLNFTYLDSLLKRINFLKAVNEELFFKNTNFLHMRAEDAGKEKSLRGTFDYAVSRAVAPLKILSEFCIPLLKKGGEFFAFKAFDIEDELNEAKSMIGNLGGEVKEIIEVKIPISSITRKIVVVEKIKDTPKEFPRSMKKIKG